jgi:hypothetical protein
VVSSDELLPRFSSRGNSLAEVLSAGHLMRPRKSRPNTATLYLVVWRLGAWRQRNVRYRAASADSNSIKPAFSVRSRSRSFSTPAGSSAPQPIAALRLATVTISVIGSSGEGSKPGCRNAFASSEIACTSMPRMPPIRSLLSMAAGVRRR